MMKPEADQIETEIAKARAEAAAKTATAEKLAALAGLFPDLKKYVGRWEKIAFYSAAANERATGVDIRHNCGCCEDSPVEAWPYVETEHGKVYTDPPRFVVGERDYAADGGERANEDWDKRLREARIPEAVIARVGAYLGVAETSK